MYMVEYIICAKHEMSYEWFDTLANQKGVTELTRDMRYLFIKSSIEIFNQLKLKFPELTFEQIMI